MKIFISWAGEKGRNLANILSISLKKCKQFEPFVSHGGIDAGEEWYKRLIEELETAEFGIVCLTKESLLSSWVHFEAALLMGRWRTKSESTSNLNFQHRLVPLLFDIRRGEIKGPLSHLQCINSSDKQEFERMIQQIYKICTADHDCEPKLTQDIWEAFKSGIKKTENYHQCSVNLSQIEDQDSKLTWEEVNKIFSSLSQRKERIEMELDEIIKQHNVIDRKDKELVSFALEKVTFQQNSSSGVLKVAAYSDSLIPVDVIDVGLIGQMKNLAKSNKVKIEIVYDHRLGTESYVIDSNGVNKNLNSKNN